jgi:1,4-dihydroxy-2-naphthoate octaprenyltransferase
MQKPKTSPINYLIRLCRPWELLGGILFYALGVGIAHYLGQGIQWTTYFLGQACVTVLQLTSYMLAEYYRLPAVPGLKRVTSEDKDQEEIIDDLPRSTILMAGATTLTVGAVLTVLLVANHAINPPALLILGVSFLIAFFYAVPPIRLIESGYGELAMSFLMANLIPAWAFLLQTGELHRFLAMLTFPLTAQYLALTVAQSLPKYASDLKYSRRNMLVRIGWQRGMNFHNLLILFSYLLIGLAATLNLPWGLAWRGLLSIPLGFFQIWLMNQIANGVKPQWKLLIGSAMGTLGLTAYLFALSLWTM